MMMVAAAVVIPLIIVATFFGEQVVNFLGGQTTEAEASKDKIKWPN
jgi:hypothetical protein